METENNDLKIPPKQIWQPLVYSNSTIENHREQINMPSP